MKFKFKKIKLSMLFVVASVLMSCECDDDQEYGMSNQGFVTRASGSNNFEIAAGGLAVSKAQSTAVKNYGAHMITDHTAAVSEMKNLAAQKGWTVPDNLPQKEQLDLAKLTSLSGNAFDEEFARIMVQSHQDAVTLFETGSAPMGVADADLRALAAARLPMLKAHLQEAVELSAAVIP